VLEENQSRPKDTAQYSALDMRNWVIFMRLPKYVPDILDDPLAQTTRQLLAKVRGRHGEGGTPNF
jgi:hypothetical protein